MTQDDDKLSLHDTRAKLAIALAMLVGALLTGWLAIDMMRRAPRAAPASSSPSSSPSPGLP